MTLVCKVDKQYRITINVYNLVPHIQMAEMAYEVVCEAFFVLFPHDCLQHEPRRDSKGPCCLAESLVLVLKCAVLYIDGQLVISKHSEH